MKTKRTGASHEYHHHGSPRAIDDQDEHGDPRAPGRIPGSDWDDSFGEALAAELSRRATRRRVAFWLLAFVFGAAMLGTTLPTPLYVIYQARWHFSAAMVTVIFAVYATAVLATLLLAGRSSDQAGRRPVLAVALGVSAVSTVVFILAPDEGALSPAGSCPGCRPG